MKKFIVTLTKEERELLTELTSKGKHRSQKILNALTLLACDEGELQQKRSKDISASYKDTKRITLVMDSLNTHTPGSFFEVFPPDQAKALWDRFEFVYTPKHGSWSNMAEIELNVLIGQCLNRRLDNIETVKSESAAWQASRNNKGAKVNWQFRTESARIKLKRLYPTLDD